jgi:RHS repeat-associated protein
MGNGNYLEIIGHLQAVGTAAQPIIFTSVLDSGPSQWGGLSFNGGTGDLEYATVRYGGTSNIRLRNVLNGDVRISHSQVLSATNTSDNYYEDKTDYTIYVENSRLTLNDSLVAGNGDQRGEDTAVYLSGASTVLTMTATTIAQNSQYGLRVLGGSSASVRDSTFAQNIFGIDASAATSLSVTGTSFQGHGRWPFFVNANMLDRLRATDNHFQGNPQNWIVIAGTLAGNTVLPAQRYELGNVFIIPAGVRLTLAPGTTIMGNGSLEIAGHLQAVGTASEPITFTSVLDSAPWQWGGLFFNGGTGDLEYTTVRYGGTIGSSSNISMRNVLNGEVRISHSQVLSETNGSDNYYANKTDYGIYVENSRLTLNDSLIAGNGDQRGEDAAILVVGASAVLTMTNTTIAQNTTYGLRVQGGSTASVRDSTFAQNMFGIDASAATSLSVTGTSFQGHSRWPFFVNANMLDRLRATDNRFEGNLRNWIVTTGTLAADTSLPPQRYEFTSLLTVPAGVRLTLAPGTTILVDGSYLEIAGHLQAVGTASEPITFTSVLDSGPSQWLGLIFNGGTGDLEYATVRYGGTSNIRLRNVLNGEVRISHSQVLSATNTTDNYYADKTDYTIYVENSRLVLNDTLLSGNGDYRGADIALYATGKDSIVTIAGSTFTNNRTIYGLVVELGKVTVARSTITGNQIAGILLNGNSMLGSVISSDLSGNGQYGLQNRTGVPVDGRNNWWGAASGPYHAVLNPGGQGVPVSDDVLFKPWREEPGAITGILNITEADTTILSYDPASDTFLREYLNGSVVHFNRDGRHDYTLDPLGNKTIFTYNANQSTASMAFIPAGSSSPSHVWYFSYANGKLISITDPASRVTRFTVDTHGHLTQVVFPNNTARRFYYDASGLMTQQADEAGTLTSYGYDRHGRISSETLPPRPTYDPATRRTEVTQEIRRFTPSYSSYPLINDSVIGDPSHPAPAVPKSTDLVDRVEYARGSRSGHTNEWGYWLDTTDAIGRTTRYLRDSRNNIMRLVYPDGDCVEYTYDDNNNRLSTTHMSAAQCALAPANRDAAQLRMWRYSYEPRFNKLKTETDSLGRTTTYVYDYEVAAGQAGNLVRVEYPPVRDPQGALVTPFARYSYTARGQLETETSTRGTVTRYVYTQGTPSEASTGSNPRFAPGVSPIPGLLAQVIFDYGDAPHLNLATTYKDFDKAGHAMTVVSTNGASTRYTYDALGRVLTAQDALGIVSKYEYNERGNLIRKIQDYTADATTGRNIVTTYTYNTQQQRLSQRTAADGIVQQATYAYDANRNLASRTDGNGNTTSYRYDDANQRIAMTDPLGYTTTYSYTLKGQLDGMTLPDGSITRYRYDPFGQPIEQVVDAGKLNLATRYGYDRNGNLEQAIDPAGTATCYAYDAWNRRASEVRDCGGLDLRTTYAYDVGNNLVRTTDERGTVRLSDFDALGRVARMRRDASGLDLQTTFAYDQAGNLARTTDQRGTQTSYEYDALYRMTAAHQDATRLNLVTRFGYDRLGNQNRVTDPRGIVRFTDYNAFGMPMRSLDDAGGLSAETRYSYDNNLNLTAITDANGHTTSYKYDARNQRVETRYADGTKVALTYYPDGMVATRTDQAGAKVNFAYDGANQLLRKSYSDGSFQQFAYDAAGRQTSARQTMSGHVTELSFGYNRLGDVTSSSQKVDGHSWTTAYDYDYPAGTATITYPSGARVAQSLDALGRLQQVKQDGVVVAGYTYDDHAGNMRLAHANGTADQTETDALGRTTRVSSTVADYRYGYDAGGNRTFMQRWHQAGHPADVYGYDGLSQLTEAWYGANATSPAAITSYDTLQEYNLDRVGNRLSVRNDAEAQLYQPSDGAGLTNPMNRYEQVGSRGLSYDAKGNLLNDGANGYRYDNENRQIGMSGAGVTAEYIYDALGRRVAKILNGAATYYVYTTRYQISEERGASDQVLARYTYGAYVDEPLTMERGGKTYTYHRDALGNVSEITSATGGLAERYTYDVYGRPRFFGGAGNPLASSAIGNPYLFTGRQYDPESQNYYFRARMYAPGLGRFMQMDPLGFVDGMNMYTAYFVMKGKDPYGFSANCGDDNSFDVSVSDHTVHKDFIPTSDQPNKKPTNGDVNPYDLPISDQTFHLNGFISTPDPAHEAAMDQMRLIFALEELAATKNLEGVFDLPLSQEDLITIPIDMILQNMANVPDYVSVQPDPNNLVKILGQQYLQQHEQELQKDISTLANNLFRQGRPTEIRARRFDER